MITVELTDDVRSSVLGFGCAPILGAVGANTAVRALDVAFDCGVNHFDLARSYGYGEAERFLGKWLCGHRDDVVLASKFGIRATWRASLLRPLKPLVRALRPRTGGAPAEAVVSTSTPPRRDPFHERVPLTGLEMRRSLEASLKALGTDHLDVFFVHEPKDGLPHLDELADTARLLKQEGKIRALGLAFDWADRKPLAAGLGAFDVLQFNASPGAAHYGEAMSKHGSAPNVLFSPLRQRGGMAPQAALRKLWDDFPNSVVLCSMFDPAHIRANASAAGSISR